jgi:pimeloyl-ACP methyl ester carboxylesterase
LRDRFIIHAIGWFTVLVILAGLVACSPPSYSLTPNPTAYVWSSPTEYYLYLPSSYVPDRDWPVFVGIHSFSGDGTDCLQMWQAYAESEGFVLVCPSLGEENGGWYVNQGEANLLTILREVRKDCRTQERIFLAGFSAGAEFVQAYAFDHPKSVRAVAVLSAGNYIEPAPAARDIPFLVVIGDQDDPLGLENAKLFTDSLTQGKFKVELDILPGVGHKVTRQALELTMAFYRRVYGTLP